MTAALEFRELSVTFADGTRAVAPLTMDVRPGEFVALLGPSGCGKSTLLRTVAGLQRFDGEMTRASGSVAFVFQEPNLLPWRNVLRNVALPLELAGVGKAARLARAAEALTRVGLPAEVHLRYPAQLSGGMRMRASLARALVTDPQLLLLDEPFAALDELSRQTLDELLRRLWLAKKMTVLFVTHSVGEAVFLGTRAVVFSPRPAAVVINVPVELPTERDESMRTSLPFVELTAALSAALRGKARTVTG